MISAHTTAVIEQGPTEEAALPGPFETASRFHPGYSRLGRWVRRRVGDEHRGEALYLVLVTGLSLGLFLVYWAVSAVLYAGQFVPRDGLAAGLFPLVTIVLVAAWAWTCVVGRRPALRVACRDEALVLGQGDRHLALPYADLTAVERIDDRVFHRHYRRYAATQVFLDRMERSLLLLRTADSVVVLGLEAEALDALQDHLENHRCPHLRAEWRLRAAG